MSEDLIKKLSADNFKAEIAKGIVLVDFYAEWCGPCRMLNPILKELAEEAKQSGRAVSFAKIDIDVEQKIAEQFGIHSVPILILFQDGQEKDRLDGLRDKEAINEFISRLGG